MVIKQAEDGLVWEVVNIYGPAHGDKKLEFLQALQDKMHNAQFPIILRGDFNLVTRVEENSNGSVNPSLYGGFQ